MTIPNNTPTTYANAPVLPPPFKVNAWIRFCRWSLLGAGIVYGAIHLKQIREKHYAVLMKEHAKRLVIYNKNVTAANEYALVNSNDVADQVGQPREVFKSRVIPLVDTKF